ncbi:MAG: hypothetical protein ACLS8X_04705 [Streptococcus salivarius]|uniref:hypothetical protein n=1 Tax=Streptococcus sp. TaxID=1306 RepID=UPI003A12B488
MSLYVKLNYLLGNLIVSCNENKNQPKVDLAGNYGSIISVVGKTTVEIIELFECTQKVP